MTQDDAHKGSIDEEIIKELMDIRGYLEKRIKELEDESEKLKALFKIVDEEIVTKSFKRAEALPVVVPEKSAQPAFKEEIPLKTAAGVLLATIYVGDEDAKIVPAKDLTFTVSTPPFQTFLITRIFEPMRAKDSEDSEDGAIPPNQVFTYETITEGEVIKELLIRNFGSRNRLREIVSSSRWTFEKMYEKGRTSSNPAE